VTTFSAHNPVHGGITVLQSQDWFEGGSSEGLIKGSVEQKRGRQERSKKPRNRATRSTRRQQQKNPEKQSN